MRGHILEEACLASRGPGCLNSGFVAGKRDRTGIEDAWGQDLAS
jgi:hypothetical protein